MNARDLDPLVLALLRALAQEPVAAEVSLPRLGKRLGQGASVLMRRLALMGSATVGNHAGPGWVELRQVDGRWRVTLTDAGRQVCAGPLD